MYILDKYISSRVVKGYLLALCAFVSLYLIIDLFSHLNDLLREQVPLAIIVEYYLNMIPLIFLQVSPFSLLISTIYSFSELNRSNEIMGMRAAGLSVVRLSLPAITVAMLLSVLALFTQERLLLAAQRKTEDIKLEYIKKVHSPRGQQQNIAFRDRNMIYFISRFVPHQNSLDEVVIFKENAEGDLTEKLVARKITYTDNQWVARDVIVYHLDPSGRFLDNPLFLEETAIDLQEKPQSLIVKKSLYGGFSSLQNLKKEITRLSSIGSSHFLSNLIVEFHRKIAEPFCHLFIIIGVLPFALEVKKRKVGLTALGLSCIFGFIYYGIFSISLALGKVQILVPSLCAWTAPLFFLVIGVSGLYLLR
jgi:lipopolysaccharide export system permease protein